MRKTHTLLLQLLIGIQLAGCSTVQDYLINAAPGLFHTRQPILIPRVLEYDFIQPRYREIHPDTALELNETPNNNFTYYSASGHRCYALSLTSLDSACNIDGQWVALAPILNYQHE